MTLSRLRSTGKHHDLGEALPVGVRRDLLHVLEVDDLPTPSPKAGRLLYVVPFVQLDTLRQGGRHALIPQQHRCSSGSGHGEGFASAAGAPSLGVAGGAEGRVATSLARAESSDRLQPCSFEGIAEGVERPPSTRRDDVEAPPSLDVAPRGEGVDLSRGGLVSSCWKASSTKPLPASTKATAPPLLRVKGASDVPRDEMLAWRRSRDGRSNWPGSRDNGLSRTRASLIRGQVNLGR